MKCKTLAIEFFEALSNPAGFPDLSAEDEEKAKTIPQGPEVMAYMRLLNLYKARSEEVGGGRRPLIYHSGNNT